MIYNVDFELCALVFLVVVANRFFHMRLFPSLLNRLFGAILWCAIADLALDIIGSYTVFYADILPIWVNYFVNTAFYSLQITFPALMTAYVLIMTGKQFSGLSSYLFLLPALGFELLLLSSLFTGSVFYLSEVNGTMRYLHGPLFPLLYSGTALYLVITVWITLKYRRKLRKDESSTILSFILIVFASILIQIFLPDTLLTGVALSLAILLMFFTLQNPEAMLDMVSGVFNYQALHLYLTQQLREKKGLWLVAVDVGGMRRVNSTLGLATGNQLLSQVGVFLNEIARENSWAFRLMGTRFLIVADNEKDYARLLVAVRARFRAPWSCGEGEYPLPATIRYCAQPGFFHAPEDVINLIDLAYSTSAGSTGSCRAIDTALLERGSRHLDVENAVRTALSSHRGFSLVYQPLYSVRDGCCTGAEALLRLSDPTLGSISPAEFIPVAELSDLIYQVDRWVISEALAFLRRHPELDSLHFRSLHVNLSAAEFNRPSEKLARFITEQSRGFADRLCLEVTETVANDHNDLSVFMEQLLRSGFRFALDDFGTGYANVARIAALPFSTVKLDRSLLMAEDSKSQVLFEDLVKMFARMGLTTVVEGVETAQQSVRCYAVGADVIQGFYHSRPLTEGALLTFLAAQTPAVRN